jgi:hypothetical protein
MAQGVQCAGKCVFVKQLPTLRYPKGHWRKVFHNCSKHCKCVKTPSNNVGHPGDIFSAHCQPRKSSEEVEGSIVVCAKSCQFLNQGGDNWQQIQDCDQDGCECEQPPGGLGASAGDSYATDCTPTQAKKKKKKKKV